jgi:amino acid transporter
MNKEVLGMAALIMGSIGGVQLWLASGFFSGLGLAMPIVWLVAAAVMGITAFCMFNCSSYYPHIAGSYTCVRAAYGHFYGFITGWSTLWAESVVLGMMAIVVWAFVSVFVPLSPLASIIVKAAFIIAITAATLLNFRRMSRAWPVLKLVLLLVFVLLAVAFVAAKPSVLPAVWPIQTLGILPALAIAIWAFSGFEIVPMYAGGDKKNIIKAVALAFSILVVIFLVFNILVQSALGANSAIAPAVDASVNVSSLLGLGLIGVAIAALAAFSAFASPCTARVPQISNMTSAMTADGMFPKIIAKYRHGDVLILPLLAQAAVAMIAAMSNSIDGLIYFSFTLLVVSIIPSCLAYGRLLRYYTRMPYEKPQVNWRVIIVTLVLLATLTQIPPIPMLVAIIMLLVGIPFYIHASPKSELAELKDRMLKKDYFDSVCSTIRSTYLGSIIDVFMSERRK